MPIEGSGQNPFLDAPNLDLVSGGLKPGLGKIGQDLGIIQQNVKQIQDGISKSGQDKQGNVLGSVSSEKPFPIPPKGDIPPPGGGKDPKGAGNPYFAPNPIAILSAAIYQFYSTMRVAELGMAQAENKGMKISSEISKNVAAAQIAAGEKEAQQHYAAMAMGAVQIATGLISMAGMAKGAISALGEGAEKVKDAGKVAKDASNTLEKATATLESAKSNVKDQTKILDDLNAEKLQKSAGTSPPKPDEARLLDKKIEDQKTVVDDAKEKMSLAEDKYKEALKDSRIKEKALHNAEEQQWAEFGRWGQVSMGVNSAVTGIGQVVTEKIKADAIMAKAREEAEVTIGQTQQQLVQKGIIDSASQAAQQMDQTMSGILQGLDKAVDAHAQANNLKG